jgi:hypothetical protein
MVDSQDKVAETKGVQRQEGKDGIAYPTQAKHWI